MSIEVIDMKKEAKQQSEKPEKVRCTLWMRKDIWKMVRHAALDQGASFAFVMELAATAWLSSNTDLLTKRATRRPS
jgi:hypothetical protein